MKNSFEYVRDRVAHSWDIQSSRVTSSASDEKLAFPIRQEYEEIDYPIIYVQPHEKIASTLCKHTDAPTRLANGVCRALLL